MTKKIKENLKKALKSYFELNGNGTVPPSILWEGCKAVMRGNIIVISSQLKKQRITEQNNLEREIKDFELRY